MCAHWIETNESYIARVNKLNLPFVDKHYEWNVWLTEIGLTDDYLKLTEKHELRMGINIDLRVIIPT